MTWRGLSDNARGWLAIAGTAVGVILVGAAIVLLHRYGGPV